MSQVHEDLLRTLIANPTLTLRELSAMYGYTQTWLCIVIKSDVFQARLREANAGMLTAVTQTIEESLETIAKVGLPKIARMVETSEDPEFVRDTVNVVLKNLGYGVRRDSAPGGAVNIQQNNYFVSREELHDCRGSMYEAAGPPSDARKALPEATGEGD